MTVDLDDVRALHSLDPGDMLGAVASLPRHCRDGYAAGTTTTGLPSADGVTVITFCGMGGSAIAGDVLRSLFRDRAIVPVDVNRGPELPAYCAPHSLVVCSSYSGNTSETLACFDEAIERGCRVVPITSGGALAERAQAHGLGVVRVPGGYVPRAAFGYLAMATLGAMEAVGSLPPLAGDVQAAAAELDTLVAALGPDRSVRDNPAKELAIAIGDRTPVIWGAEGFGAVAAARWKGQMNENAKVAAWWSSLPELDHNEVVGWADEQGLGSFVIALRHQGEHPEVAARFELSLEIARDAGAITEQVWAAGATPLERLLSLVAMGDAVSTYLGLSHGVDPTPMEAIDRLKAALEDGVRR